MSTLALTQPELRWGEVPAPSGARAWFIRYGVWVLLAIPVLGWEITGFVWRGPDHAYAHPTLSGLIKSFESRTGLVGNGIVTVGLIVLFLHWVLRLF